jgi:hypothetical protein
MIRFEGRSHGVTTILGKPVPTGSKSFALASIGYIFNWEYTASRILEGEDDEDISFRIVSIPEKGIFTKLSNIQAVI